MGKSDTASTTMAGSRRIKLTLIRKIILGYAAMALFTLAALAFSIHGLISVHRTAREIAKTDLVFVNTAQQLRESVVSQERYAGKFLILGSSEFRDLFSKREQEFRTLLASMRKVKNLPDLENLNLKYNSFRQSAEAIFSAQAESPQELQDASAKILTAIDSITANEQVALNAKLEDADLREQATVSLTLILSFTGFLLASAVAAYITISISRSVSKLKQATHRIAEGEFDYDPKLPPGDEIGDLARDFTHMASRLKELEQMSLDASPLTRLPGNIAIERILNKRLADGVPFAVCYGDLDNFKAYNDHYGYIKGSELIKLTGEIIYEEVRKYAGDDAFVGHVGGDDFVMVLSADRIDQVCSAVNARFDEEIKKHYRPDDLERGAIAGVDRYGVHRNFPIMTMSISVLVCKQGEYDSAVDIAYTAAQIKDHVKSQPGSNYFVNRRRSKR